MHRKTKRFAKCFESLPDNIQKNAKDSFKLLKSDSAHPSLHFKKVGGFWSARIGLDYRALAIRESRDFIWVWIGTHDEYERTIRD